MWAKKVTTKKTNYGTHKRFLNVNPNSTGVCDRGYVYIYIYIYNVYNVWNVRRPAHIIGMDGWVGVFNTCIQEHAIVEIYKGKYSCNCITASSLLHPHIQIHVSVYVNIIVLYC